MAKFTHDTVLDQPGTYVQNNVTALHVCATQPTSRADALSKSLAAVSLSAGDVTLSDGDTNGRKFRVAAKSGVSIGASGTADHIAIISSTLLLCCTTCTSQALVAGGTVDVPAWDGEFGDPT
jgi:hypothetical protein